MGRSRRDHPKHLASKLRQIRLALNLTQEEMAGRIKPTKSTTHPGHISEFERGLREPTLPVLLRYARLAGVYVDALIDDDLDLPKRLPMKTKNKPA
ncbi:MAG: Helix-turn-helix domain [Acidobacteriota bacterium]|jgi:transcriptional regulator with XRE-family HTH domain|nr:Helix-turn-helix domain [Acidobacteriota bacterium]